MFTFVDFLNNHGNKGIKIIAAMKMQDNVQSLGNDVIDRLQEWSRQTG